MRSSHQRATRASSAPPLPVRLLFYVISGGGRFRGRIICFLLAAVGLLVLSTRTPLRTRTLQLLHRPGSDGTFAQNHQDNWPVSLAEKQHWRKFCSGMGS